MGKNGSSQLPGPSQNLTLTLTLPTILTPNLNPKYTTPPPPPKKKAWSCYLIWSNKTKLTKACFTTPHICALYYINSRSVNSESIPPTSSITRRLFPQKLNPSYRPDLQTRYWITVLCYVPLYTGINKSQCLKSVFMFPGL